MSNNPQHVVTGKVRLSYAHLFQPYANPKDLKAEPKYSTVILLPKSDTATKQRIDAAVNAAIERGITTKWGGVKPPHIAICIHDGDGVKQNGEPYGDECKGHWVFTASSKQPPEIVDASVNPIITQSEVYSGIYARVSVQFYPYEYMGKKGIGCGLGNVQKLEDGEPLGGRTTAADDFGAFPAPQPQPVNQQPQQQPQPAAQTQIDPITGKPVVEPIVGGVMGI